MRRIKIPQQDFVLKRQGGGAYARGEGAYLWDTTVKTNHPGGSLQATYIFHVAVRYNNSVH